MRTFKPNRKPYRPRTKASPVKVYKMGEEDKAKFKPAANHTNRYTTRREDYAAYVQSKAWADFKEGWFERHPRSKRCKKCKSKTRIQLHHIDYRYVGAERDYDVIPLCHDCHERAHSYVKNAGYNDLKEGTKAFLDSNLT